MRCSRFLHTLDHLTLGNPPPAVKKDGGHARCLNVAPHVFFMPLNPLRSARVARSYSWSQTLRCLLLFNGLQRLNHRGHHLELCRRFTLLSPASCLLAPSQKRAFPCETSWTSQSRRGDAVLGPKRRRRTTPRRPPRRRRGRRTRRKWDLATGVSASAATGATAGGAADPITCTSHVRSDSF